jgi:hypothetical protein
MPVINNEFDAYLENKAIADGFVEREKKRERKRPNYFIDEQARLTKEKRTKKCKAERKEAEKHCLDYDSEDAMDALKSKHCTGHSRSSATGSAVPVQSHPPHVRMHPSPPSHTLAA